MIMGSICYTPRFTVRMLSAPDTVFGQKRQLTAVKLSQIL